MIDPIVSVSFSVFENKGVYALLLGSGVSRAAQIPTGWEITTDLVRRLALLSGVVDEPDWVDWYRKKFGNEPSYSELLNLLADTADQRRSILHSYIEPTDADIEDGKKLPTSAHKSIARLVRDGFVRVVITTNFDRLLENSLREVGVEPTVIRSDDDIQGAVPLAHARCYVIKLHGDYLDTRIKNTDAELNAYSPNMSLLLDRIFDEFGLIICGWSADWDGALRAAIARSPSRRYSIYWASRGKLSPLAVDLVENRGAKKIDIESADEFFEKIQRNVETQSYGKYENPRSIELLISNAKRLIGRVEERVRLEELIGQEIKSLVESLRDGEFDPNGAWSDERFQRIAKRYETVVEPAVRLFGILGRWGDGSEVRTVVDVIQNLSSTPSRNGLVVLNNIRSYPARLLLFGYGIGLLKAARYSELFRLFTSSNGSERNTERVFADSIIAWDGDDKDIWNKLAEFPDHRRRTPLSDHLHTLFSEWTSDYLIFRDADFTRLFENFELLGGLAYMALTTDEASLTEITKQSSDRNFAYAPMGRASWDYTVRRAIFDVWKTGEVAKQLIAAGFARSSGSFLDLATKSFENQGQRQSW